MPTSVMKSLGATTAWIPNRSVDGLCRILEVRGDLENLFWRKLFGSGEGGFCLYMIELSFARFSHFSGWVEGDRIRGEHGEYRVIK